MPSGRWFFYHIFCLNLVNFFSLNDVAFDHLFCHMTRGHSIFNIFLSFFFWQAHFLINLNFVQTIKITKKIFENFTLKYNWKMCSFFLLLRKFCLNIDSHVNFWCLYDFLIPICDTNNGKFQMKNTDTKYDIFFYNLGWVRIFFQLVTTWQFEQKFRKLMFVAFGAASQKFHCIWYIWHSACAQTLFGTSIFFSFAFIEVLKKKLFDWKIFLN